LIVLGFEISERTVPRWMHKARRNPEPAKRWATSLGNHREAIAAMDFFTVPTLTFGVRYCCVVIGHDRRRILHWEVTRHPTSAWVAQQLREAFPYDSSQKYLIFDRATNFDQQVIDTLGPHFSKAPCRSLSSLAGVEAPTETQIRKAGSRPDGTLRVVILEKV